MKIKWAHAFSLEIFWLSLIALFVVLSVIPLFGVIADEYLLLNAALALLFAFYFRAVIFFNQVFYLQLLVVQVALFLGHVPLFVLVLGKIQEMVYKFDTYNIIDFFQKGNSLTADALLEKFHLFRTEFLVLSVGVLVMIVLTELRIIAAFVQRIKKFE